MINENFDIALVNLVKKHSNIYDRSHKHFKNKAIKDGAWAAISRVMNRSKPQCLQRWKGLRIRYTVEKRKVRTEGKKSTWKLFDTMAFLDKFVVPRPSRGYRQTSQGTNLISVVEMEGNIDEMNKEDINISSKESLNVKPKPVDTPTCSKRSSRNNMHWNDPLSAEYAFGKTVGLMLKNIRGNKKRRKVQLEIMEVLYNYDSHSDSE